MSAAEPSRSRSAGGRVCLSSNQRTSPMENGQWNHTNMQLMSNTPTGIYPTKIEIYAIPNTIDLEKLEQKHHQPRAAEIKPLGDTYPNHSQTAVMIVNAFTLCYSSVARCGNGKSPLNEGLNGRNIYIIRVDLDCFAYCPESIPIEPKKTVNQWQSIRQGQTNLEPQLQATDLHFDTWPTPSLHDGILYDMHVSTWRSATIN